MFASIPRRIVVVAFALPLVLGTSGRAAVLDIGVITWDGDVLAGADIFVPATTPAKMTTDEFAQAGTPVGNAVAWWDTEIQVQRSSDAPTSEAIEIEMDVFNQTGIHWDDFHITLGFGVGATFVESDEFDNLFFNDDPTPSAVFGLFPDPPSADEVVAPDNLWWAGAPGVGDAQSEIFEVGINVPVGLFDQNNVAVFTIRKHATIPEPSAFVLLGLGVAGLMLRRRVPRIDRA